MPTPLPNRGPHRGGHYWRVSMRFQDTRWWERSGLRYPLTWMDFDSLYNAIDRLLGTADAWFDIVTSSNPLMAANLAEEFGVEADHDVPVATGGATA